MGFFTDADKKEESRSTFYFIIKINLSKVDNNEAMFPNFQLGSENPQNGGNFFLSRQGISTQKSCKTDPNDQNFMICKVKETKLIKENGEVNKKYIFFLIFSKG